MRDDDRTLGIGAATDAEEAAPRGRMGGRRKVGKSERRRPNGTGSIRPVKGREDYWRADLTVKGIPYSATGTSPAAAWKNLQDKITKDGRRLPGTERPDKITVAAYIRAWLERRKLEIGQGLELRSWRNHERSVNLHLVPVVGHLTLAELTAAELERHNGRLMAPPSRLAVKTVREINGTLRLALRRLPRDFGIPNVAADVELPKRERLSVQYPLRADQMRRLWQVAAHDRYAALWLLASYFPSRSGELRDLKWSDLDLASRVLLLQRSLQRSEDAGRILHEKAGGKTAANPRVLELNDELVAALEQHRLRQDEERRAAGKDWVRHDLIFCSRYGTPILSGALLRRFRRLLKAAGLPTHHRVHDLRHTGIQSMLLSGVPLPEVSGAAGHASPAVTSALYAHAVRRVSNRVLGTLGEFYRTGHAEHEHEPAPPPRPLDGQARALSAAQLTEAQQLRAEGWTQARLAGHFGVSPSTVNRALREITGRRPRQRSAAAARSAQQLRQAQGSPELDALTRLPETAPLQGDAI